MDREEVEVRTGWWVAGAFGVLIGMVLMYILWFGIKLGQPLAEDAAKWGAFGDYIGGVLNPIVALMALYWLTRSVRLQKEELAATRAELREAAYAQTRQVKISAEASRLSAIDTLLGSLNQEFNTQIDYLRRLHESQRAGMHIVGLRGQPLLHGELGEEIERTRVEIDKINVHKEGLMDLLHKAYRNLELLESYE
jgi:hypothetical protein